MVKYVLLLVISFTMMSNNPVDPKKLPKKTKEGIASIYHNKFEGRKTATGEIFKQSNLTAASNHYPLGTKLKVINKQDTSKWVIVRVNDRMSKSMSNKGRIVDLTTTAGKKIGLTNKNGLIKVSTEVLRSK